MDQQNHVTLFLLINHYLASAHMIFFYLPNSNEFNSQFLLILFTHSQCHLQTEQYSTSILYYLCSSPLQQYQTLLTLLLVDRKSPSVSRKNISVCSKYLHFNFMNSHKNKKGNILMNLNVNIYWQTKANVTVHQEKLATSS